MIIRGANKSTRVIKRPEDELIVLNIIQVKIEQIRNIGDDLNYINPTQKNIIKY